MAKSLELESTLALRQWMFVGTGVLLVAVPWWLGLLWMVGAIG